MFIFYVSSLLIVHICPTSVRVVCWGIFGCRFTAKHLRMFGLFGVALSKRCAEKNVPSVPELGHFRLAVSRPNIWRCLVFSEFLFQHVAPKKKKNIWGLHLSKKEKGKNTICEIKFWETLINFSVSFSFSALLTSDTKKNSDFWHKIWSKFSAIRHDTCNSWRCCLNNCEKSQISVRSTFYLCPFLYLVIFDSL